MLYFDCVLFLSCAFFVLRLFLVVPWVGLQCVIVALSGHVFVCFDSLRLNQQFFNHVRAVLLGFLG